MKRYQNPEVYERLALEYSLGTMHGQARKRFERLMRKHPFIQLSVEQYDNKLAELVMLLPKEKPAPHVWKNIEASINAAEGTVSKVDHYQQSSWWQSLFVKGFGVAAALVLAVSLLFFNVGGDNGATAYASALVGENAESILEVVASKDAMELKATPTEYFIVPEGMQAHFWCVPKNSSEPIMDMGIVPVTGMNMKLTAQSWKGIVEARMFGITFEPIGSNNSSPSNELVYKGIVKAKT